ncbi:Catechol 1,2-dioxygenase [Fulvia fulva]|uniref:Catechol 1,2-dioxygenase n=1 Tax=Passalora fulva TaxID=5499 RepID=A0A9Q8UTZ5_PASFU|nr:Catechol 1,2-dioxygenase [Fulvia fulva]KAK4613506.1 Catechol 1,2-dioxygenase [Fulvia fulva]KAK4614365.1 Catechol 1,2-dioxygenase [Fulvia fulva]UJO22343.1 Catechol 1,2-dioxygenase [Fulvia fulva]WPV19933.1 Catechol 1,2-dioxygenase [Fulvia fulva]WPV35301.1 Catechol 1,2-dioxygenase [Fulvia fulva]
MATNGINENSTAPSTGLGKEYTEHVIKAMGPKTDPRLRQVMSSLIRHVHDFAREVDLTVDEWMTGVQLINECGRMSDNKRNEGQLLCDVIGLESLVDDITYKKAAEAADSATASAILGPFWRQDTPTREFGSTITFDTPKDGRVAYVHGTVSDAKSGKPLSNATVDVWQASTNGLYEQQDDKQVEHNLRGKFLTNEKGEYAFYCLRPTPYPVPNDGPAGKLLELMDRHPYRPAHIHYIVTADGHKPITTQIFDSGSDYLDNDSVFAVKDDLVVKFEPRKGDPQASWELKYDVSLAADDAKGAGSAPTVTSSAAS